MLPPPMLPIRRRDRVAIPHVLGDLAEATIVFKNVLYSGIHIGDLSREEGREGGREGKYHGWRLARTRARRGAVRVSMLAPLFVPAPILLLMAAHVCAVASRARFRALLLLAWRSHRAA